MPLEFRIDSRASFADGHAFGEAGPYEILSGIVELRVDPRAAENRCVVDLDKAPRDRDGLVTCSADVCLLKPLDMRRGNRRVFFDYGNRGSKRALQFFNDAPANNTPSTLADAGNGFLMRQGYAIAWLGWQGDLRPGNGRMVLRPPVATDDGQAIVAPIRVEFIASESNTYVVPIGSTVSIPGYPSAWPDNGRATLTRRRYPDSPRLPVDRSRWSFSRIESGAGVENEFEASVIASDSHVYLADGFETGWIYELIYEARDPLVLGLGHVAVRDFVAWLRREPADDAGTPNPLLQDGSGIEKVYAWGRSQTGRCIRDFVYRGFNDDGSGRRVFDGVMPHVAGAGKKWMNHRFANAVIVSGMEYENHHTPVDTFPFSYARSTDHFTGVSDAILSRPETDPLVIHTDTASEYWCRRGSLVVTDTRGQDLPQPETVRVYLWSSSQHFAQVKPEAPKRGAAEYFLNNVPTSMFFRANLVLLDEWASHGRAPPTSRYPSRKDETLVSYEAWRAQFPSIPGVTVPRGPSRLERLDFGPDFAAGIISEHPPRVLPGGEYPTFVPAVDANGNDVAGLRAPVVAAPLGTYAGWNMRPRDFGTGAMLGLKGAYFPFPDTADERDHTGDPRPSIEELYETPAGYVEAIRQAALTLVADRLMLAEDMEQVVAEAADWGRPRHAVRLPGNPADRSARSTRPQAA